MSRYLETMKFPMGDNNKSRHLFYFFYFFLKKSGEINSLLFMHNHEKPVLFQSVGMCGMESRTQTNRVYREASEAPG